MNKTITILLGLAAGTALAYVATTKRGKRLRSKVSKGVTDLKDQMTDSIEKRAKSLHDSAVRYS